LHPAGVVFVSPDFRLIPPGTAHDILEDIVDLFTFLSTSANNLISQSIPESRVRLNPDAIAVVGTSGGSLCAYLAAMHARPKPKAVLSMYGLGGNFFDPLYLTIKTEPFFLGREIIDPVEYSQWLYPQTHHNAPRSRAFTFPAEKEEPMLSDSPLAYHPPTHPTPGWPANPRMHLGRLYMQLGEFLDYYTGRHNPSLSLQLRNVLLTAADDEDMDMRMKESILEEDLPLFPQLHPTPREWPPTLFIHGNSDRALKLQESLHLHGILRKDGADVTMKIVDGQDHSFDYQKDAEQLFGQTIFNEAVGFLVRRLYP